MYTEGHMTPPSPAQGKDKEGPEAAKRTAIETAARLGERKASQHQEPSAQCDYQCYNKSFTCIRRRHLGQHSFCCPSEATSWAKPSEDLSQKVPYPCPRCSGQVGMVPRQAPGLSQLSCGTDSVLSPPRLSGVRGEGVTGSQTNRIPVPRPAAKGPLQGRWGGDLLEDSHS